MRRKQKMPKERNAAVVHLIKRAGSGSGVHGKSKKAERRAAKVSLRQDMDRYPSGQRELTFNQSQYAS